MSPLLLNYEAWFEMMPQPGSGLKYYLPCLLTSFLPSSLKVLSLVSDMIWFLTWIYFECNPRSQNFLKLTIRFLIMICRNYYKALSNNWTWCCSPQYGHQHQYLLKEETDRKWKRVLLKSSVAIPISFSAVMEKKLTFVFYLSCLVLFTVGNAFGTVPVAEHTFHWSVAQLHEPEAVNKILLHCRG